MSSKHPGGDPGKGSREKVDVAAVPVPKLGAVAVIDALGFREARREHGVENLVEAVSRVRRYASTQTEIFNSMAAPLMTVAAFSDSIIVAAVAKEPTKLEELVVALAGNVAGLLTGAAFGVAPLAYRGCIAVGPLHVSEEIFIGEAIDEAAEWYEQASAAVVWLTPKARQEVEANSAMRNMLVGRFNFVEWELPLKGVGLLNVLAVNPFMTAAFSRAHTGIDDAFLDEVESRFMQSFSRSARIDVVQKAQNTAAFLKVARAHTITTFPAWRQAYKDAQVEIEGRLKTVAQEAAHKRQAEEPK